MTVSDPKASADIVTAQARAKRRRARVRVGDLVVLVDKPTAAEVRGNVAKSKAALEKLKTRLLRRGVRVNAKKDVPLYYADETRRGVYFRKLNGKLERGVLENGAFKVTD